MRINAFKRSELQVGLGKVARELQRQTAEATGAYSEPVKKAAGVLARAWRELLSTPGGNLRTSRKTRRTRGTPSASGQPPHLITGKLRKYLTTAVVDGVRRVGSGLFKARLLEFGLTASVTRGRRLKRSGRGTFAKTFNLKSKRRLSDPARRTRTYTLRIAARPSAERALANAAPRMTDVFVDALRIRGEV